MAVPAIDPKTTIIDSSLKGLIKGAIEAPDRNLAVEQLRSIVRSTSLSNEVEDVIYAMITAFEDNSTLQLEGIIAKHGLGNETDIVGLATAIDERLTRETVEEETQEDEPAEEEEEEPSSEGEAFLEEDEEVVEPEDEEKDEPKKKTPKPKPTPAPAPLDLDAQKKEIDRLSDLSGAWNEREVRRQDRDSEWRRRADYILTQSPERRKQELEQAEREKQDLARIDEQIRKKQKKQIGASDSEKAKLNSEISKLNYERRVKNLSRQYNSQVARARAQLFYAKKRKDQGLPGSLEELRRHEEYLRKVEAQQTKAQAKLDALSPAARIVQHIGPAGLISFSEGVDLTLSGQAGGVTDITIRGEISRAKSNLFDPEFIQKSAIFNRIGKSNDPLEILGIDPNDPTLSPQLIKRRYAYYTALLYHSKDPRTYQAILDFRRKMGPYIDTIDATPPTDPDKLKLWNKRYKDALRIQAADKNIAEATKGVEYEEDRSSLNPFVRFNQIQGLAKQIRENDRELQKEARQRLGLAAADVVGRAGGRYVARKAGEAGTAVSRKAGEAKAATRRKAGEIGVATKRRAGMARDAIVARAKTTRGVQRIANSARVGRAKDKTKDVSGTIFRMLYEYTIRRFLGRIIGTAKRVTRIGFYLRPRSRIGQALGSLRTRFMAGRGGKAIIAAARAGRGVKAMWGAAKAGGGNAMSAAIAQYVLFGSINPLVTAGVFAAGASVNLVERTLASKTPHWSSAIRKFQGRFGSYGSLGGKGVQGPMLDPSRMERGVTKLHSGVKALGTGMYGFTAGVMLGSLLGLNPWIAGAVGATAFMGGKYGIDRLVNRLGGTTSFARMPVTGVIGIATAVPWIEHHVKALQEKGLSEYIKDEWLSVAAIYNSIRSIDLAISISSVVGGARALGFARMAGLSIGTAGGLAVATLVFGINPLSYGALAGAAIGGTVGYAVGGAIGSVVPVIGTTIVAYIGSFIGSLIGSLVGDWLQRQIEGVDKFLGLLGILGAMKAFLDFFEAMMSNLKDTVGPAVTFSLFLLLSGAIFLDALGISVKDSDNRDFGGGYQEDFTIEGVSTVRGKEAPSTIVSLEQLTTDCLETQKGYISADEAIKISKIKKYKTYYEIETDSTIYTNITDPTPNLQVGEIVSAGTIIGYCPNNL